MSTLDDPAGDRPAAGYTPQQQFGQPPVPPPYSPQQHGRPQFYAQPQYGQPQYGQPRYAQPRYGPPSVPPQYAPVGYAQPAAPSGRPLGPVGRVRSTWAVLGLTIITLGIYSLYYYFATHQEMKDHSGEGVGGVLGLVIALFTLGLVTPFLFPHEVGNLYARQQRPRPVSATTGLWVLLGSLILVGPLVWLIKTNGALNAYWRSMGAR